MALTPAETQRLAQLQATVEARRGKPGYTRNVQALDAEIAKLGRQSKKP